MKFHTYKKIILLLLPGTLLLGNLSSCTSKKGCTDSNAINYNKKAKIENGTCEYADYNISPVLITQLKSKFDESSALLYQVEKSGSVITGSRIWTLNDGGNTALLYTIDLTDGGELENDELKGVINTDWEDMAQDDNYIYVGDFGNNNGNRTDLVIQRVPKIPVSQLKNNNNQSPDQITYNYPDQKDFRSNDKSDYDCEAMIAWKGNLYIFTKCQTSLNTKVYKVPAQPGAQQATLIGVFESKGVITGADISEDGTKLALSGYHTDSDKAFVWLFKDYPGDTFFNGKKAMINLGQRATVGQIEGIAFKGSDSLLLSNEVYKNISPSLYYLNISGVK